MEQRDYFNFSSDYWQLIEKVPEGDRFAMMKAVVLYGLYREDTAFDDPLLDIAWTAIRQLLEKDWRFYDNGKKDDTQLAEEVKKLSLAGKSYRQIADELGISKNKVGRILNRK